MLKAIAPSEFFRKSLKLGIRADGREASSIQTAKVMRQLNSREDNTITILTPTCSLLCQAFLTQNEPSSSSNSEGFSINITDMKKEEKGQGTTQSRGRSAAVLRERQAIEHQAKLSLQSFHARELSTIAESTQVSMEITTVFSHGDIEGSTILLTFIAFYSSNRFFKGLLISSSWFLDNGQFWRNISRGFSKNWPGRADSFTPFRPW